MYMDGWNGRGCILLQGRRSKVTVHTFVLYIFEGICCHGFFMVVSLRGWIVGGDVL